MQLLEPLQFTPALKERIWGGPCRKEFLPADMPVTDTKIGEYWQIYDRPGDSAVIRDGVFAGRTLHNLISEFGAESVIGSGYRKTLFPVMVKILDAKEKLSIQVHPGKDNPFGTESKTEIWYPLECGENAGFMIGTKQGISEADFWDSVYDAEKLMRMLQFHPLKADHHLSYLIQGGCIHALCENTLVLEVQENSDTTYRISDWGRLMPDGTYRELHLEKAKRVSDFNLSAERVLENENTCLRRNDVPFAVEKYNLNRKAVTVNTKNGSFHILSPVSGDIRLRFREKDFSVKYGDCILIPASCGVYEISAAGKEATVLRTGLS